MKLSEIKNIIYNTKVVDIHTHLEPNAPRGLVELLNYHYLVAEYFLSKRMDQSDILKFYNNDKYKIAELVYDELFVKNFPISQSSNGIRYLFDFFGIDWKNKSFSQLVNEWPILSDEAIFEIACIEKVFMTNYSYDNIQQTSTFLRSVRTEGKLMNKSEYSYVSYTPENRLTVDDIERFEFTNKPLFIMLGVKRNVSNIKDGGDISDPAFDYKNSLSALSMVNRRILISLLSTRYQTELNSISRANPNIVVTGLWWYTSTYANISYLTYNRFQTLGWNFIPYYSDARVPEQLIYKWASFKNILSNVLSNITNEITGKSIHKFLNQNPLGLINGD